MSRFGIEWIESRAILAANVHSLGPFEPLAQTREHVLLAR